MRKPFPRQFFHFPRKLILFPWNQQKKRRKSQTAINDLPQSRTAINDLPPDILKSIISLLPLAEAVRTSAVCKLWQNLWKSMPSLILDKFDSSLNSTLAIDAGSDDEGLDFFRKYHDRTLEKFLAIVNRVLVLRQDAIQSVQINTDLFLRHKFHMDNILLLLYRIGVQKLKLRIKSHHYFIFYPYLFFASLTDLYVEKCILREFPSSFEGFEKLKILSLMEVDTDHIVLNKILASSPVLEILALSVLRRNIEGEIRIGCPNLISVGMRIDSPPPINLKCATLLEKAVFQFVDFIPMFNHSFYDHAHNLIELLKEVCHLNALSLYFCRDFVERLDGGIPYSLSEEHRLQKLTELELQLDVIDAKTLPFLSFLLRSCPHLEMLGVLWNHCLKGETTTLYDYWAEEDSYQCISNTLKTVEMKSLPIGCEYAVRFAKFLMSAGVLEKMIISCVGSYNEQADFQKDFSSLQVAFPNVQMMLTYETI